MLCRVCRADLHKGSFTEYVRCLKAAVVGTCRECRKMANWKRKETAQKVMDAMFPVPPPPRMKTEDERWKTLTADEKRQDLIKRRPKAELLLCQALADQGVDFIPQAPIGCYFADILIPLHKLVVEVDGGYHGEQTQQLMDFRRSLFLKNSGYSIIRVKNEQVNHDAGGIALAIMNAADGRAKKKKRR